jgi:hypothetical protein
MHPIVITLLGASAPSTRDGTIQGIAIMAPEPTAADFKKSRRDKPLSFESPLFFCLVDII